MTYAALSTRWLIRRQLAGAGAAVVGELAPEFPLDVAHDVRRLLPATVSPDRVALVGLHEWTEDHFPHVASWGIQSFAPDDLRASSRPVLDWLAATGCSRVAYGASWPTSTRPPTLSASRPPSSSPGRSCT
ncbi:hypothetical protein [Streptomyces sp. PSAA01]|uniref:hypothetical protein n=1 Tax=Streptomyces sp. PSAA01 TaxID=2912762 RepID=UPI001F454379|nr:hypothetical protein [Streptomyces sp. PSAA01]MCG0283634.1 hypothetical protein [Streptomyces sp. PSAA01]